MREKILLRRRATPKVVTLPNGITFTAKQERISRKQLPINIHVKNARKNDQEEKTEGSFLSPMQEKWKK